MPTLIGRHLNKGEWAEFYVLLKLLGEGRLYAADEHLRKKPDSYLEVLKIIREEIVGMITEYDRTGGDGLVRILCGGEIVAEVSAADFLACADTLFSHLLRMRARVILAPASVCRFADVIHVTKPKAPSIRSAGSFGGKSDIVIQLLDGRNSMVSTMGFSIKSQFASPPTLFNAGTSSQLLFEMRGMDDGRARKFNSFVDAGGHRAWADCVAFLKSEGIEPVFVGPASESMESNLLFIRESMADVLAWMYRERLLVDTSCTGIRELCERMAESNPLGFRIPGLYEKAVKDFLFATFSGMTASRPWDGTEQVNGGYIVVLPSGDVLCYHANDREDFRDYLYRNTYLEYVSCTKYRWGYVEKTAKGYVLPLNASVRFKKRVE